MAKRNSSMQLGTVASMNVGTGAGQVPMTDHTTQGTGWLKLPSGYILQWGTVTVNQTWTQAGTVTEFRQRVNFPIAFPTFAHITLSKWDGPQTMAEYIIQYYEPTMTDFAVIVGYNSLTVPQQDNKISFFAVGY